MVVRVFKKRKARAITFSVIALLILISGGLGLIIRSENHLTLYLSQMDQSQKNFLTPLVTAFELETGIEVDYRFLDTVDLYKDLQKEEPSADLYYFISNYSLRSFQSQGLLGSLPLKKQEGIDKLFFSNPYYLPISWYPWGFYYNETLFDELNLSEPQSWEEFLRLSGKVEKTGVHPSALLTKIKWPSTIWFDYIDIKINGVDYHQKVLNGQIPFTDEKIINVFEEILYLHQKKYIHMISDSFEWTDLRDDVTSGLSAMNLSGTFFYADGMNWFPFPEASALIASSSGFVQSKDSGNKRVVKKFLQFVLGRKGQQIIQKNSELISVRADVGTLLNRPDMEKAFSILPGYDRMTPSFERNTHDELLLPLKSAISSLYSIENEEQLLEILTNLEKYRISLK